ncbi:MAG: QueT transporter family protein [Clostridia bacterium]|nr:QueT transporter family protein [Clostridia bacterium]
MHKSTLYVCYAAVIAALYVVLTLLSAAFGLSSGVIQFRLSEALCVLPIFTSAAIPGLTVGCLVANLVTGAAVWDVVFGSLATLLGALGAYALRRWRYLASLPTVIANVAIIPPVLIYAYNVSDGWLFLVLTIGVGELVCCTGIGSVLVAALARRADKIFRK